MQAPDTEVCRTHVQVNKQVCLLCKLSRSRRCASQAAAQIHPSSRTVLPACQPGTPAYPGCTCRLQGSAQHEQHEQQQAVEGGAAHRTVRLGSAASWQGHWHVCGCLTPVVLGKDSGAKPLQLDVRSFSMACYGCSTVCTIRVGCRQSGLHTVATSAQQTLRYMQCSAHIAERLVTAGVTSLGAAASHTVATSATDSLQCMHRSAHDG